MTTSPPSPDHRGDNTGFYIGRLAGGIRHSKINVGPPPDKRTPIKAAKIAAVATLVAAIIGAAATIFVAYKDKEPYVFSMGDRRVTAVRR